jgi:hypothetical protein
MPFFDGPFKRQKTDLLLLRAMITGGFEMTLL